MMKIYAALGLCALVAMPVFAQGRWTDMEALEANVSKDDYGTVTSVLIMENGQIAYEGYFNGANANSLHNTRSVPKTITGMAVGAAVDDGLLRVDMPAASFFGDIAPFENPDPRKFKITIEDVITMSSVLECDDNDRFSRGNESRMSIVEDWTSFFWDLPIRGYPGWSDTPATAKYGRVFSYCSAGVEMAGQLVERATKTRFQDYVKAKFFDPMDITQFEWQENGLGQAHKSGGLSLTARDLAKFAEMQRNNGVYNGERILSQSWTDESVKPRAVVFADREVEYGYLWWRSAYEVSGERYENYFMTGNGGNRVVVMPAHELVVVITKTDYNTRGMHQATDKLIEKEIIERLSQ
ncbi:serine hydrolase domain-containing protein [Kordiimonas aquimaris]|uniref:serine hydrolase domain-containing protein n=1 Tax=Kordiimonas aquimaris TaxID=707591 RepID=UPI0021D253C9|nr:serine hydrolase [Kordiimonas aquimaris]